MSFVTRFDLIRTQLKRPFEGDPATLEFARWATDSNTVIALRDGWLGVAPPLDREATDRFRIVGASEWVPDLAPDLDMKPVTRDAFERLAPMTDVAIGIHNPGQQLRELVRAITFGSGQYVTEQDVPKDEQVDLLPTLDELDGDAAVGWRDGSVLARVTADDPEALARDVNDALATAKAQGKAIPHDGGLDIAVATPWGGSSLVHDGKTSRAIITGLGTAPAEHLALLDESGIPRRPPVLWIWKRGGDCTGDAAGWVTFDNVDELRFSIAVERVEQPTCQVGVTLRTLQSLDFSDGVISN